jgi:predicted restriction endonuclease
MEFFIKKLKSNESGYTGEIRDERGEFILIPKNCHEFFPPHLVKYRNDITLIDLITPSGDVITRKYDWHNTKFHPEAGLKRGHDEKRLYRSKALDQSLNLDRDVFFVCTRDPEGQYYCFSITVESEHYDYLDKKYNKATITEDILIESIYETYFSSIKIKETNIFEDDIFETFKDDTPKSITQDLILKEPQFRELVLKAYNHKCAVRKDAVSFGDRIILQAAHIKPKRHPHSGPNIPSNGLALSYDLHRMFDEGMWTLSDKNEVFVHEKVRNQDIVGKYHMTKIQPVFDSNFFKPDLEYIKFHRENEFGRFDLIK